MLLGFDLPEVSPKNKRPMDPAKVEWTNLGEEEISKAKLKVEVQMPDGSTVTEKFSVPSTTTRRKLKLFERRRRKTIPFSCTLTWKSTLS